MLGIKEVYKSIKDIVENSQNILIILDEHMPELREVSETYTDTWDKMVRIIVVKRYQAGDSTIIAMNPDFEELRLEQPPEDEDTVEPRYTETYHLEGVESKIVASYERIKQEIRQLDPQIRINPQKYYISLRRDKNFAYIQFSKKRMHIILTMPYEEGRKIINKHRLSSLSEGVKKFYGADCCRITIEDDKNMEEIIQALKKAYQLHLNPSA
jgi:predicted transport protein